MTDADRLPEIQARAANGIAGSNDVDWLIGEVQTLRTQLRIAEKHATQLDDALAASYAIPDDEPVIA